MNQRTNQRINQIINSLFHERIRCTRQSRAHLSIYFCFFTSARRRARRAGFPPFPPEFFISFLDARAPEDKPYILSYIFFFWRRRARRHGDYQTMRLGLADLRELNVARHLVHVSHHHMNVSRTAGGVWTQIWRG